MKKRFARRVATRRPSPLSRSPAARDPGAGGGDSAAPAEWPAQDTDLEGTTLTIWAAQNSNKVPDSVVAGFEELTGAKVDVVTIPDPYEQSVQTKVATGDKPDLAFWQPTASLLTALNASTNLQSLDGAPFLDSYQPELRDITGILDDTRYAALITTPAVEGVYYNKEVFEEAGITELPDELGRVRPGRPRPQGRRASRPFFDFGGGTPWATQWWVQVQLADAAKDGLWDRVNANEETFTDPTIQGAIDTYDSLIDEGLFNENLKTATFEDQGAALLAGDAAMAVQVNSFFGQLQSLADDRRARREDRLLPDLAERQRRHVHPRPVQRARRLQDRRRQAGGGSASAADLLARRRLRGLRQGAVHGVAAGRRRDARRRAAGAARRERVARRLGRLDAGARGREPGPVPEPR